MTALLVALTVTGAVTVLTFVVYLVLALTKGFRSTAARVVLGVAGALGAVCAVLGFVSSFVD